LQVMVYVDGVLVAEVAAGQATPHSLVSRLCQGLAAEGAPAGAAGVGFSATLPPLAQGEHEVQRLAAHH
jgi:hypothetical protein